MLLAMFTVYLFFLYFGMFFERRKKNIRVLLGIIVLVLWQVGIPEVINELPKAWNIGTTVGLALFVVANVFEGKAWMKCFFHPVLWVSLITKSIRETYYLEKLSRLIRFQKGGWIILEKKIGIIYIITMSRSLQKNNLNGRRKCGIGEMEIGNIMLPQENERSSVGSLRLAV